MRGEARRQRRDESPCHVYWGSHGCKKHRGHQGVHVCTCGERPGEDALLYGEDVQPTEGIHFEVEA